MKHSILALLALAPISCAFIVRDADHSSRPATADAAAPAATKAICVLRPTAGNESVRGTIKFTATLGGVLVEARVEGLAPGAHGFHVHEWGDLDCTDGMCTGGHFNPSGEAHGAPDAATRHAGDLGNLEAGADGVAVYKRLDARLRLDGAGSILGRGIVVHAKADDFTTQPTGNAGARVATGVIGIAKP